MIERDVKDRIKDFLNARGCYWYMPVPMGYGKSTVDFLVCYRGHFIGIETKNPAVKDVSVPQARAMKEITAAGGTAWMENSTGLEETKRQFKLLDEWLEARSFSILQTML